VEVKQPSFFNFFKDPDPAGAEAAEEDDEKKDDDEEDEVGIHE